MTKSIVEKLNLHKFGRRAVLDKPADDDSLSELRDYDTELGEGRYDLIFAYVFDMAALQNLVRQVIERDALTTGGYLFAAYPKKGNKVYPTYIHRDSLFEGLGADADGYVGTSSLKFARMVGLDEVFTVVGFKSEARGKKSAAAKPSQRVDDYTAMIPEIERELAGVPDSLAFYRSLTPGYRKEWARYVFSAVQEQTRAKRLDEMKRLLREGYKTIAHYRNDTPSGG